MTYDAFLALCNALDTPSETGHHGFSSTLDEEELVHKVVRAYGVRTTATQTDYVVKAWDTGGAAGGSCWGGEASTYTTDTPEPDFELLDLILEKVAPTLTYLAYKRLLRSVGAKQETFRETEYYGNHTRYAYVAVSLPALYETLKEAGHLA